MGALCGVILGACANNPGSAFPTAEALAAVSPGREGEIATLNRGRKIFTTACTECHVARPIAGYSVAQWRHRIAQMAPRAHLSPEERAALESYLIAVRESLPSG
jgi:mono/diheme cytochrome c family protein